MLWSGALIVSAAALLDYDSPALAGIVCLISIIVACGAILDWT